MDMERKKSFHDSMEPLLGHERLHVYRRALSFVSWRESLLGEIDEQAAVLDHLARASESIVQSIANGNSRRSTADRNRYFDVATGSALECAACMDIGVLKEIISSQAQHEGKDQLRHIVRMTVGLRNANITRLREDPNTSADNDGFEGQIYFAHEELEVYRLGLEFIQWLHNLPQDASIGARNSASLDKTSTSLVLNIAEGNGRFSSTDHRRFLDIAHTCAINTASGLDLAVARGRVQAERILEGKQILRRLVPMLTGLQGYLTESGSEA